MSRNLEANTFSRVRTVLKNPYLYAKSAKSP